MSQPKLPHGPQAREESAAPRRRSLAVLLVEDSEADAMLLHRALERGGYDASCERVDTAEAMRAALLRRSWDVVISDDQMPRFSATAALALLQETALDLPFLIVSGAIGEEAAVAAMKAGANDYILKGNDARLVPAVERELREAEGRRRRARAERNTALLLDVANDLSGTLELSELFSRVQRRAAEALGCDGTVIFTNERGGHLFHPVAHHGIRADLLPQLREIQFNPSAPIAERIARGEVIVIQDAPWLDEPPYSDFRVGSLIAAPLRARNRHLGAFVAFAEKRHPAFDSGQVDLLMGIARQLAVAIETAQLYQTQQQEAQIAGALARVGHDLISSRYAPTLLDRLCQLTTEVLNCDCSHTFLLQPNKNTFAMVAGFGDTPEQNEALRVLEIPRTVLQRLLERLETHDVAQVLMSDEQDLVPSALPLRYGIQASMYMGLRRGNEVIAILTAARRDRAERFSQEQERIGTGVAQLASMAFDNVRLVEELERANRLKSDFLATMSHELRTPLNIIIGYNDLLREEAFGSINEEQRDSLERVAGTACQLLDLINGTLDLSRLESGQLPLEARQVDPARVIAELESESTALPCKEGLQLRWNVADPLPVITTDPVKLKLVLRNLVENAVKFTEQGEVEFAAQVRGAGVEFIVRDTGIGIAPEDQLLIFEPFRQVDSSDTRRHGGVGLGLYLARRMLDLMGGTIGLESEPGSGSTFRIWVPLESDA